MVASPTLMPVIVFPSTLYVAGRAREAKMRLLADRRGRRHSRMAGASLKAPLPATLPQLCPAAQRRGAIAVVEVPPGLSPMLAIYSHSEDGDEVLRRPPGLHPHNHQQRVRHYQRRAARNDQQRVQEQALRSHVCVRVVCWRVWIAERRLVRPGAHAAAAGDGWAHVESLGRPADSLQRRHPDHEPAVEQHQPKLVVLEYRHCERTRGSGAFEGAIGCPGCEWFGLAGLSKSTKGSWCTHARYSRGG